MPRKARDERLQTRADRLRLPVRREPYWRHFQEGRAIGYRRLGGGVAGTWIARFYDAGGERVRKFKALGHADDLLDADGVSTLTFDQAQNAAREWFRDLTRARRFRAKVGPGCCNTSGPVIPRWSVENHAEEHETA